ncbi:GGDEF domain-containing protein [Pusillimonas sp. MFBS29]|uniref:GGDEF domain-containing protein n=1 Tax=Pusillimonas sp. MFBS29 TaxID=2886690 RepID=UPI001D11174A|nr:GGDEF domain-containing protein [Pusillimonas sp. MFBS29]MCC2596765.1 GGDEF domain-containing protein [Pusillimonas sp. MFBS29]
MNVAFTVAFANPAIACHGAQNIRLLEPVTVDEQQLAEFHAMPKLTVYAASAPPLTRFHEDTQSYSGISTDIFCFIANELGIDFTMLVNDSKTVHEKIRDVQTGDVDVFMPISRTAAREKLGLFTEPYYESYYAVLARHGSPFSIKSINDLANYKVGVVKGVALEHTLQAIVPESQLHSYDIATGDLMFQALREGAIDVAVYNETVFIEKQFHQELFDLEIIYTLENNPRAYRYYFSPSAEHKQLVQVTDQYLAVIDASASIHIHEGAQRQFFQRYEQQRDQQFWLELASVSGAVLAVGFYVAFLRYRRLSALLADQNSHIRQQQHALQAAYEKLEALSLTDSLTGLSNRRHFEQMLSYEYARNQRTASPLSLLFIDIDYFKSINDHFGHTVGDKYLCSVAKVLDNSTTRATDLAARYGGDEFLCLLPDTAAQNAVKVAERITHNIAELALPNPWTDPPQLTVSIGVITTVGGNPGIEKLMAHGDAQLYTAKKLGRNQVSSTVI